MDTAQQALFRDMLNHGWFTDSNGSIYIHRHGDYVRTNTAVLGIEPTMPVRHAMLTFANRQAEYTEWADSE